VDNAEVTAAILEMRDLLRLLAKSALAEQDKESRQKLRDIVGQSSSKAKAVMLMDGTRTQVAIHNEAGVHQGNLSTMVKQMGAAGLLIGETKQPKLGIFLPKDFFTKAD
jgi:hypothetical protein